MHIWILYYVSLIRRISRIGVVATMATVIAALFYMHKQVKETHAHKYNK